MHRKRGLVDLDFETVVPNPKEPRAKAAKGAKDGDVCLKQAGRVG